jgi:hypothetical protein
MIACPNCGTELNAEALSCFICGTTFSQPVAAVPADAGGRVCPACGQRYAADYHDSFCNCGVELTLAPAAAPVAVPAPPVPAPPASKPPAAQRPPAGTRCLVFYGPDRKPTHYFPLTKDVTLIGRIDVVQGSFPDIDVDTVAEPAAARKVSRRHTLILHSRADDRYVLRSLPGNTGTQVEVDMVPAMADYPLTPGTRIILGGAVRFKFEVA